MERDKSDRDEEVLLRKREIAVLENQKGKGLKELELKVTEL